MNLFIKNNTDLPLRVIGEVLDKYKSSDKQITIYNGLIHKESFFIGDRDFFLEVTYRKTRLSVVVTELNIRSKEVDMSDVNFPNIPSKVNEV